jgi:hypothetical protein
MAACTGALVGRAHFDFHAFWQKRIFFQLALGAGR